MGNYKNLEIDFIDRTLKLISQYNGLMYRWDFDRRFNHTLLINCLLGLIVMPKERVVTQFPNTHLTNDLKEQIGITNCQVSKDIINIKSLLISLRHSIAHFEIVFRSNDEDEYHIDLIEFYDSKKGDDYLVAAFLPDELLNFINYLGSWIISNIQEYNRRN